MKEPDDKSMRERLERYLDADMDPRERAEFELLLERNPQLQRTVALQQQLDAALQREFAPPAVSREVIQQWLPQAGAGHRSEPRPSRRVLWAALTATAAALAWAVVAWQWNGGAKLEPFFQQRMLVELYQETVAQDFQPYYFCEDPARFAATFVKRQQIPLQLAPLPADRRMVGLSYLGGFSRDTTAILGYAQDQPVIVFVDRREVDQTELGQSSATSGLNVFRRELAGLVLYEVSPLDRPQLVDFLTTL
jgi:anti-sigma factor RsiW